MADTGVTRDFPCSVCGAPVGYRELYPPGVPRAAGRGGEHPGRRLDRYWQYLSNGDRTEDREVTPDEFAREVAALGGEHAARFIALYCGLCQLVYCFDHGTVDYSDEPPHAFGMCPQAHWRVIDMG